MADVGFNSSDHKLTESDVPQGTEGLQKSSQAAGGLAKGQETDYWTPEPAASFFVRPSPTSSLPATKPSFRRKKLWTSSGPSHFGQSASSGPTVTGQ